MRSGREPHTRRPRSAASRPTCWCRAEGEIWRRIRNGPITVYGGRLLIIALVLARAGRFYLWQGPIKVHGQLTGRMILRFSAVDRIVHWTVAISFVVLAIAGIIMLFGKYVVLPVFGYTLFSLLAIVVEEPAQLRRRRYSC